MKEWKEPSDRLMYDACYAYLEHLMEEMHPDEGPIDHSDPDWNAYVTEHIAHVRPLVRAVVIAVLQHEDVKQ